jgi:hypothetical protein
MTFRRMMIAIFAAALASTTVASAQDAATGPTPPRLGFIDGDVSFWRPGAEDWTPAQVNTPIAEGDEVYAAAGANVELQIGPRAFVRAGGDTQIGLETLDAHTMQYEVNGGHAAFDVARLPSGQTLEVDTPKAAFRIDRPGYYRVDVEDTRTVFGVRRGGRASATGENGESYDVGDEQRLVLGDDATRYGVEPVAALDDWDRWNYDRTGKLGDAPRSAQYVSSDVAGVDDLDRYGEWRDEPRYGRVWTPRQVAPDWTPYSTGRWVYDPYYEWSWVDDAPWGWCPYHYGRWVHFDSYWGWAPGPVVVSPAYSPALVAFFGAPGIGVSVSVGLPFVSWVPLGFGEPVVPWWGGSRWSGRPYWGGWGGPRIVNNVVVNNWNGMNVRNITRYQNMGVHHAIVGVDRNGFGRRGGHVFLDQPGNLRPVHGRLDVRPAAASLTPSDGRGHRPPDRFQNRPIVTTRAPRDPVHRLQERGVQTAAAPTRRPEARVVKPEAGGRGFVRNDARPGEPARVADGTMAPERRGLNARQSGRAERVPEAPRGRTPGEGHEGSATLRPPNPNAEAGRTRPELRGAPDRDHGVAPSVPRDAAPTPMPRGDRARQDRPARALMRSVERAAPRPAPERRVQRQPRMEHPAPPRPEARRMTRPQRQVERQARPQPQRESQRPAHAAPGREAERQPERGGGGHHGDHREPRG